MLLSSNQLTYDNLKKITIASGSVVLTCGTLIMKAERVVVIRDSAGYQSAKLYSDRGKLATFRQKQDNGLWIKGHAERIEYNSRTGITKLLSKAEIQRFQKNRLADKVNAQFIYYNSHTKFYNISGTPNRKSGLGASCVKVVIQPHRGKLHHD